MKTQSLFPVPVLAFALAALMPWSSAKAGRSSAFTDTDRAWWSFQPVREPTLPEVEDKAWVRNAVDRFILAGLEKADLVPAAEAAKATLVRRVFLDVTGLPPSREEVESFVGDPAPDAWEKLVDRLLASPRYGERQARLWLDLVRYADSDGYRADHYRPEAWRYRDYVIGSFNADKPYDRFLSEQLAGDELFPDDPQALVATGYLRHWIYEWNNRDVAGQREVILNDITDTTADVFMGLGLQCARCHDHKFDPLLQKDYYRLQAFFTPLVFPDQTPVVPAAELASYQEKMVPWETATADVRRRITDLQAEPLAAGREKAEALFPPETLAMLHKPDAQRTPYEKQIAALTELQVTVEAGNVGPKIRGSAKEQLVALQKELGGFDNLRPPPVPTAATARDIGTEAPPLTIPRREAEGPVEPGFPTLLQAEPARTVPAANTTGRRSALAAWLADPANPLTARVMVNRVWQQHFGKGLSTTASDFGTLGDQPSHPELLDWLAQRFVADGWSLKKLHRLIMTSAAWKQSHVSPVAERAKLTDPENRLLWRWTTRRLEAEQIRDALFQATGELDLKTGGPGVDSNKPRRAIYTKILRNTRDPLTDIFDAPQNFQSTASRDTTTTATQSLFLANSRFMAERAEAMAAALAEYPDISSKVEAAWWRTAGRAPLTEEREESLAFLTTSNPDGKPAAEAEMDSEKAFISESMPQRGGKAMVLAPGSALERIEAEMPALPADGFSVEAVALLHSVYESGEVRTLAGLWSGDGKGSGWALGITGMKSRRKPQMPVMLLCGPDRDGKLVHEPVFSDFSLQLDRSYYLGASFQPASATAPGQVVFWVKDLANDDEPLLTTSVPHPVTALTPPPGPFFIGASHRGPGTLWDGLIDEVRLTRGMLTEPGTALRHPAVSDRTLACWQFEPGAVRVDSASGIKTIRPPQRPSGEAPAHEALTDLCHALLSSSAMLYVE